MGEPKGQAIASSQPLKRQQLEQGHTEVTAYNIGSRSAYDHIMIILPQNILGDFLGTKELEGPFYSPTPSINTESPGGGGTIQILAT